MKTAKRKQDENVDEKTSMRVKKKVKSNSNTDFDSNDDLDPRANSSNSSTPYLHTLLDFSSLSDESAISSRFDEIARILIHEYHLVVGRAGAETVFEIQEMEFYLQKAVCHEDPFTHGSEEQKVSGRWYFHRAPRRSNDASRSATSLTGYRGGTRKGLDLTIGGPLSCAISPYFTQPPVTPDAAEQEAQGEAEDGGLLRGGILLRSLRGLPKTNTNSKSSSVSGPSLLVDKILELSGASSISELVENMWRENTTALDPPDVSSSSRTSYLYLKHVANPASALPRIHKSPRIGLDLSHPGTTIPTSQSALIELHPRIRFLSKTYRYFTRPEELVKGRPQTFYGLIHATLESHPHLVHRSLSGDKTFRGILATLMNLKNASVEKYLVEYDAGRRDGLKHLKLCIGAKGAADSPASYLKLMGALEAVLNSLPHGGDEKSTIKRP